MDELEFRQKVIEKIDNVFELLNARLKLRKEMKELKIEKADLHYQTVDKEDESTFIRFYFKTPDGEYFPLKIRRNEKFKEFLVKSNCKKTYTGIVIKTYDSDNEKYKNYYLEKVDGIVINDNEKESDEE